MNTNKIKYKFYEYKSTPPPSTQLHTANNTSQNTKKSYFSPFYLIYTGLLFRGGMTGTQFHNFLQQFQHLLLISTQIYYVYELGTFLKNKKTLH